MMTSTKNRVLSWLLCLCFVMALVPVVSLPAKAATSGDAIVLGSSNINDMVDGKGYTWTISGTVATLTITDMEYTSTGHCFTLPSTSAVKTLSLVINGENQFKPKDYQSVFLMEGSALTTINISGSGTLIDKGVVSTIVKGSWNSAAINMTGASLRSEAGGYPMFGYTTVTISGGSLYTSNNTRIIEAIEGITVVGTPIYTNLDKTPAYMWGAYRLETLDTTIPASLSYGYTVTYNANNGTNPSTKTGQSSFNATTPTTIPSGATFDGWWSSNGNTNGSWGTQWTAGKTVSADTAVYARWKHPLTLSKNSIVTNVTSNSTSPIAAGTLVTVTATMPTDGNGNSYAFQGWSGTTVTPTGSGKLTDKSFTFRMPNSAVSLQANGIGGVPAIGKLTVNPWQLKGDCTVTVSGAPANSTVTLRDSSGNVVHTLAESGSNFTGSFPQDGNTYDVWVDGFKSGKTVTLDNTAKSVTVDYTTYNFTATLDGQSYSDFGTVTIKAGDTFYPSGTSLPTGSAYEVHLNGEKVGVTKDFAGNTLPFFTVSFTDGAETLPATYADDTPFKKQIVRKGGTATEPEAMPTGEDDTKSFSGWGHDFSDAITDTTAIAAQWQNLGDFEARWVIDGETSYGSLDEALKAVADSSGGGHITVQKNAPITETATLPDGSTLTIPESVVVTTNDKLTNNGAITNGGTISGNLANGGKLVNNGTVSGGLTNSGSVEGGSITGNVTNTGSISGTDIGGTTANTGGTLTDCVVGKNVSGGSLEGYIYAKDGVQFSDVDASDATVCIKGGNERFAGLADESGGKTTINGDLILRNPIPVEGELDLNDHSVRGQDGSDGSSGVTPIVVKPGKDLTVTGPGEIIGGNGGASTTGNGGNGGHGIDASGGTSVVTDEDTDLIGGHGATGSGSNNTGGDGGSGVWFGNGTPEITVEGSASGGNGGPAVSGATGGKGGDAIGGSGNATIRDGGGELSGGSAGDGRFSDPVNETGGGNNAPEGSDGNASYSYAWKFIYKLKHITKPNVVDAAKDSTFTLVATADATLPNVIQVAWKDGKALVAGTDYTYNSETGAVKILAEVGSNITVRARAYLTPNATISTNLDYLNALVPDTVYLIEGKDYTADENGKIAIQEDWYGKEISIKEKPEDVQDTPPEQLLDLSAITQGDAPPATDFIVTHPSASTGENSTGKVEGIDSIYEYSTDGGLTWTAGLDDTVVDQLPGDTTVLVRVPGTAGHAPSKATPLYINPYRPSGGGSVAPPATPGDGDSLVIVDGKPVDAGTVTTDKESGETTTVVNQDVIVKQIDEAKDNVTVIVPIADGSTTAAAELVVQNIDDMAKDDMTLTVTVGGIAYELPTTAVDTAAIMAQLGTDDPAEAPFTVRITPITDAQTQAIVEASVASFGGEIILPAMDFTVTASYGGQTVTVPEFGAFVSRTVEITTEQAAQITTGLIVYPDGTSRHVPTEVFAHGGKWYARINSLTNSTYVLVYNELTFADAAGKWYEAYVNEMGSRMVINGVGDDLFAGERSITRAEFAAIVVRALGLPFHGSDSFVDVHNSDWYADAVNTAAHYGIVSGRGDGVFDPLANITREEAMAMVQRAAAIAQYAGKNGELTQFSDADTVSAWAKEAVRFNVGSGLIVGSDGALRPQEEISRAETATVVLRLLQQAGLVDVRS